MRRMREVRHIRRSTPPTCTEARGGYMRGVWHLRGVGHIISGGEDAYSLLCERLSRARFLGRRHDSTRPLTHAAITLSPRRHSPLPQLAHFRRRQRRLVLHQLLPPTPSTTLSGVPPQHPLKTVLHGHHGRDGRPGWPWMAMAGHPGATRPQLGSVLLPHRLASPCRPPGCRPGPSAAPACACWARGSRLYLIVPIDKGPV